MTLLEVEELCGYWAEHPPVHLMVAGYLGIGRDADRRPARGRDPDSDALPSWPLGMPGLGPARPFSVSFGGGAIDALVDLTRQYETAKAN